MDKEYAEAIATMSGKPGMDEATLVAGLVRHLKASGRMKLLPAIVRELRVKQRRNAKLAPVLEIATREEEAEAKAAAKKEGIEVSETIVNPSLIRGWRVRANGLLWDHSAKRALTDIYKKITN